MGRNTRTREKAAQGTGRTTRAAKERAAGRLRNYGISPEEVDALIAKQDGRCAICREGEADSVDHCHASGRIRGMLCRACNAGLGFFRDEPQLLRAAAAYLQKAE